MIKEDRAINPFM